MLGRSITVSELVKLNKMFNANAGYKDLIRDFKKEFNITLDKHKAKEFIKNRSWKEVFLYLTGQELLFNEDNQDKDKIPAISAEDMPKYELLSAMMKLNNEDELERRNDINEFIQKEFYIPSSVKYFNLPLYNQIITYKYKEPFIKAFLLNDKRRIEKIETIYISDEFPWFLLEIIRKINSCDVCCKHEQNECEVNDCDSTTNICYSELFKKYGIVCKD